MGIDISGQRSKGIKRFEGQRFDCAVMVCSDAAETCPFFSGGREQIHHAFPDPADVAGSDEETLSAFRISRNGINRWSIDNLVPVEE
jgi:arsenate reductase